MQLTKINGKYELWLPEHRAERPQWDMENGGWEAERMEEILKTVKRTDVVFYTGCEEGDLAAVIQKYTDCDMVLFEPNDRVWSCMKHIWQENKLKQPLDFYPGFLSDKTTNPYHQKIISFENIPDEMVPDHGFKQLYENYPDVPQITLDDYCKATGLYPDIFTLDCEGCEYNIMRGAEKTLKEKKPIIFMSAHPEFQYIHYGEWMAHLFTFMAEIGYSWKVIEYEFHELHLMFTFGNAKKWVKG